MNVIKVKINFKRGTCAVSGIKLITTDYASTTIKFTFDDKTGTNIFTLLNPLGEIVYSEVIQNNEVPLYRMADVTTVHNDVTYVKYTRNNAIYWYDPVEEKLYTDAWVEVVSFDLDNYTKVQERASLFTMKGSHKFEVSKYVNDSKLTSVSGSLKVKKNIVQMDSYAIPYLSVFDTLLNQVDNVNIDVNKSGTTSTVTVTYKDGTTKSVQILDGAQGPQGIQGPQGNPGVNGQDGFSPIATVTQNEDGATITITDKNGTTTATVGSGTGDVADVYYDDESVLDSDKIAQLYSEIAVGSTAPDKSQKIWIDTSEDDVALKDLQDDTTHRLVTDTEKTTWNGKQDALVSGTNIKTINGQDITGSGNITIESGTGDVADVYYDDASVLDSNDIAQLYSEIAVGSTAPTKSQKIWIDTTESDVALKDLSDDTTHRLVTDTEKTTWNGKLDSSAVKTTTNTTAGNVYDVTYINTMLGNIESLLSNI